MKYLKLMTFLILSFIIVSSIMPQGCAETQQDSNDSIIDTVLLALYRATYSTMGIPWAVVRFQDPQFWNANESVINLKYLEKSSVTLAVIDSATGEYMSATRPAREVSGRNQRVEERAGPPFMSEYTEFKLEFPEEVPEDAFYYAFQPSTVEFGSDIEGYLKTELMIFSKIPLEDIPVDSFNLRLNITRYISYGNLFMHWPVFSLLPPNSFAKYGGKLLAEPSVYVGILVNVKRFNLAEITPPAQPIEIKPDKLTSVPIDIINLGSHKDSFNFKVNSSTGNELLLVAPPNPVILEPGQEKQVYITLASPRRFQDPGTAHSINIEAYSIYEPDKVFDNTAIVITRGVYISEMNAFYSAFFGILILIIAALFLYIRRRKYANLCIKPDEPWEIEKEKKNLEKLKEKDPEKYKETMKMMQDEYKSAMLWYKYYRKAMIRKTPKLEDEIKGFLSGFVNKLKPSEKDEEEKTEEPAETKPKKKLFKRLKEKKPEEDIEQLESIKKPEESKTDESEPDVPEEPEIEEPEEEIQDESKLDAELEKIRKEKAISKVKKQQEKQRKKLLK